MSLDGIQQPQTLLAGFNSQEVLTLQHQHRSTAIYEGNDPSVRWRSCPGDVPIKWWCQKTRSADSKATTTLQEVALFLSLLIDGQVVTSHPSKLASNLLRAIGFNPWCPFTWWRRTKTTVAPGALLERDQHLMPQITLCTSMSGTEVGLFVWSTSKLWGAQHLLMEQRRSSVPVP